jgi:hypothetical protein
VAVDKSVVDDDEACNKCKEGSAKRGDVWDIWNSCEVSVGGMRELSQDHECAAAVTACANKAAVAEMTEGVICEGGNNLGSNSRSLRNKEG